MRARISERLVVVAMLAMMFTNCSQYSKSSRQQRAYSKYVQKSQLIRSEQQALIRTKNETMPPSMPTNITPSEPVENVEMQPADG